MNFLRLLLAASALWALVWAGPAGAQVNSVFLEAAAGNRLDPRLPNLIVKHLSYEATGPDCPQNVVALDFYYPQGFGRPEADRAIETRIKAEFEARRSGLPFCDRDLCDTGLSCGRWPVEKTFAVFSPSPRYVSVLFTEDSYTGGAHGNLEFDVVNFDLKTGRPLALTDLFPKPEQAGPRYWRHIYAEWCRTRDLPFPLHAVGPCRPGEAPPEPPADLQVATSLEDLGRLIFTSLGATLLFEPYEAGSYAEGSIALDLPRETLLEMGANPALWAD